MKESLPVLAICGFSGAGKTTLILTLLHYLVEKRNLSVAILKNDVHGLNIDCPGKDTDRFFNAGADVHARGPKQSFRRAHPLPQDDFYHRLQDLAERYDFVLVEGHKGIPLPKVWLLSDGEDRPPEGIENVLAVLPRDIDRQSKVLPILKTRLQDTHDQAPVYGCILIGGKSRRMGQPKHLLTTNQKTWLARTIDQLSKVCSDIVICGRGEIPQTLPQYVQLPDPRDVKGPMAGILACMRWLPNANWLVAACDLPNLSTEALNWLLSQRTPGRWAVVPQLAGSPGLEPLLAYYDGRCRCLFEALAAQKNYCPLPVAEHARVLTPTVPHALADAWKNANTPEALRQIHSTYDSEV
jgi:molybdopterin-guanine dinucleotide biosynthesis protein A